MHFRQCPRCDKFFNSIAKRPVSCEKCKIPTGRNAWRRKLAQKQAEKDRAKAINSNEYEKED